jgi:hypothetical protein
MGWDGNMGDGNMGDGNMGDGNMEDGNMEDGGWGMGDGEGRQTGRPGTGDWKLERRGEERADAVLPDTRYQIPDTLQLILLSTVASPYPGFNGVLNRVYKPPSWTAKKDLLPPSKYRHMEMITSGWFCGVGWGSWGRGWMEGVDA